MAVAEAAVMTMVAAAETTISREKHHGRKTQLKKLE